jgi:hypothetical protein
MESVRVPATADAPIGDLGSYLRLYERHLRAANRADATIYKYLLAVRQLIEFLDGAGMPTAAAAVHREHVEAFMEQSLAEAKASTRYQALRVFFGRREMFLYGADRHRVRFRGVREGTAARRLRARVVLRLRSTEPVRSSDGSYVQAIERPVSVK